MGKSKMFPIQSSLGERGVKPHPLNIPWWLADLAYSVYSARYGRSQSLEHLAERGGFGANEMDMFVPDWREQCNENARLTQQLAAKDRRIAALEEVSCERCNGMEGLRASRDAWRYRAEMQDSALREALKSIEQLNTKENVMSNDEINVEKEEELEEEQVQLELEIAEEARKLKATLEEVAEEVLEVDPEEE